ncbi:uncharacterized protein ColSpa_10656 [Colletotrichum spaethianum]|uniref:UbiD family decarboxylase n=1 Tax=Colletotrichum spaethianum TaxID=700344 RepID=A0AA37UPE9_9PEZI|nr:uncharacterized protein ColSpa_10656 [Colletotrichum spaethianum]GKT50475.1 hypothetical protein ColSpa_10656 [Colletotrichum spaethianum]
MKFVTALSLLAAASQHWRVAGLPQFPDNPVCAAGITSVEVQPVQFIVRQPIYISAFLPVNTVLVLDDGLTLTITNAPMTLVTEIDKLGTLTSQVTRILQQTSSIPNAYVTITRGGHAGSLASTITVFPSGPDGLGTYLVFTPFDITAPTTGNGIPVPPTAGSPAATVAGAPFDASRLVTQSATTTVTVGGLQDDVSPRIFSMLPVPGESVATVLVETGIGSSSTFNGPLTTRFALEIYPEPGWLGTATIPPTGSNTLGTVIIGVAANSELSGIATPALTGLPGAIPGPSPASIPVTIAPTGAGAGALPQSFTGPYSTVTIGGAEGVPRNLTIVNSASSDGTVFVQTFDSYSITVTGPQNVITVLGNAGATPAAITLPGARALLQTVTDDGAVQIIQTPGGEADSLARLTTITVGNADGQTGVFTLIPTSGSVGAVVVQTAQPALGALFQTISVPGATETTISIPAPEGSTGTVVVQTTDGYTGPAAGPFTTVNVGGGQGGTPATVTIPPAADDTDGPFTVLVQSLDPAAFTGPFTTITAGGNNGDSPVTLSLPPTGTGQTGTVVVQPAATPFTGPFTTITTDGNTGSLPVTLTVVPAGNPTLGTVIVQTPSQTARPAFFRTLAALPIGGQGATMTLPVGDGSSATGPGTVVVASGLGGDDPATTQPAALSANLVTIRGDYNGTDPLTVTLPSQGNNPAATVVEQLPVGFSQGLSVDNPAATPANPPVTDPATNAPGAPTANPVPDGALPRLTSGYSGSVPTTVTLPPVGTQSLGQVLVLTPLSDPAGPAGPAATGAAGPAAPRPSTPSRPGSQDLNLRR